MMTSSNLPSELTQVLRYVDIDAWQPPHSDRNVSKTVGVSSPKDFGFTLPHDINSYAFSKYAEVYLKDHQLGASKMPLRMSIIAKQTAADNKESIDINKVILHYLYEPGLSIERRQVFAAYIVHKGILSSDAIRDEIYVQLCSQSMGWQTSNRGPFDSRNEPVWNLMVACLCSFPPTNVLAKYLLKYVSDNAPPGYDMMCQHKLLHCLQQQQPSKSPSQVQQQQVRSAKPAHLTRAYAPCLLEYKAAWARACMALTGILPNGDRVIGQVESWMTAEQFASHLLRQRNVVDPSNSNGWTVALRDEFDVYESAGNDFILDLIGEIEVPPYVPTGTAYFLTTTDTLRSNMSSSARQKWPSQPHNAERLRLMMLDVEELPDLYTSDTSLPLTPESMSPRTIVTPPVITRQRTESPIVAPIPIIARPAPPTIRSEDVYASRDELMSTQSALNKRREPTSADQLSKTSALNSRYAEVVNPPDAVPLPSGPPPVAIRPRPVSIVEPPALKPELSVNSKLNGRYVDAPEPPAPVMRPGKSTVVPPPRTSMMQRPVPQAPIRTSSVMPPPTPAEPSLDQMIDRMFGDLPEDSGNPRALQRRMKGGGDDKKTTGTAPLSPPVFGAGIVGYGSPYGMVPGAGLISPPPIGVLDPSIQLYQQQQQQLYLQAAKQQQAAELQAALQAQQLHNQLLEQSVQGELLKRKLQDLQKENNGTSSGSPPPPAAAAAVVNGFGGAPPKQVPPPTFAKPGSGRPLVPIAASKSSPKAPSQPVVNNGLPSLLVPPPPPPPQFSGSTPTTVNGKPEPPPLNMAAAAAAVVVNGAMLDVVDASLQAPQPAASGKVAIKADAKSGDKNTIRMPPKKIGQIQWPPKSSLDEEEVTSPKPKMEIGRIKIEEMKESEVTVDRKLPPEEAQRRVNDMITAARMAESAGEMPKKKPLPPTRPAKQDRIQTGSETATIDMKARQEFLEKQLSATWRKKDLVVAPPAGNESSRLSPTPPVVKFAVPPPPPPPPPSMQPAPMATEVPLSPVTSLLFKARPPVDYNDPGPAVSSPMTSFDVHSLDHKRTVLHAQCTDPYYTYDQVNWSLEVRKEVFSPAEKCENVSVLSLVFPQIVVDVLNEDCVRIGKVDRQKMTALLDKHNINGRNAKANHNITVKREVVMAARDLPIYFCRLFAVYGGRRNRRVQMVGVSHSGVRLLTRFKDQYKDYIEVLNHIRFDELTETSVPRQNTVVIQAAGQRHIVYTPRAAQLIHMIETYRQEHKELTAGGGRPKPPDSLPVNLLDDHNLQEHDDNPFDDSAWD